MLNLVGVVVAFVVIIVLIRKGFNFGFSLILGALILGMFSLQTIEPVDIPGSFVEASIYSFEDQKIITETIELALLVTLIFILAKCMQDTEAMKKLVDSLRTFFSKGGTLGVIPAVYGLMPVPGGALFSAPMVSEEGKEYHLSRDQKNFLNVWFRHIWFPIYPISSAMILICSERFSNIDIYLLILVNIPAFLVSIVIGYFYLKKFVKKPMGQQRGFKKNYRGLIYLFPPVLPLILYGFLQFFGFPQIRSFIIGVFLSIVFLRFMIDGKGYLDIIKKSLAWRLPVAIFGIMIFREMFEVSKANVVFAEIISGFSFPAVLMIIIIPLSLGLVTGYNLGAIALSYFLVESFFPLSGVAIVGLTSIIFISSLAGYLISPIHLCNVLSSEYFKTDITRMYKMYIPAVFSLLFIQTGVMILMFAS
jgi:hypothetical protein